MSFVSRALLKLLHLWIALPGGVAWAPAAWAQQNTTAVGASSEEIRARISAVGIESDRNDRLQGITLRFPAGGDDQTLGRGTMKELSPGKRRWTCEAAAPGGIRLVIERHVSLDQQADTATLKEEFRITPSSPLTVDLEIERPFTLRPAAGTSVRATCPLYDGWARTDVVQSQPLGGEYRMGCVLTSAQQRYLALPMVQVFGDRWRCAILSDPTFGALVEVRRAGDDVVGSVRYRYAGARVPLQGTETRTFGFWLASGDGGGEAFGSAVDAFFRIALPDVPAGPAWIHDIAMVGYDYLSDEGNGWERDLRTLAKWLTPEERRRVALCLHGWYDGIGAYCYDAARGRMKEEWTAFERTRKVKLNQAGLKRRLRLARELGFRVLLYFADGLLCDSGSPGYREEWIYKDAQGRRITGWQGPDSVGENHALNPAHPDVVRWFHGYLDALLKTYGSELDGVVWDETFYVGIGRICAQPRPAYMDRAMLALVGGLRRQMETFDPQKAFLTSDAIGVEAYGQRLTDVPGYGMVAHGTFQDTGCLPHAWSFGLFANWRNCLWSCNWRPLSRFENTRWGVERVGAPVAISNGWEDDRGPAEWKPEERDRILDLFRRRLTRKDRVRLLLEEPKPPEK